MNDGDIHISSSVGTTTTVGASSSVIHQATMKSLCQFTRLIYNNTNTNTNTTTTTAPASISDEKCIEVVMGPYYGFLLASLVCDVHVMELSINSISNTTRAKAKANNNNSSSSSSSINHPEVTFNHEDYYGSKQLSVLSATEQQTILSEYLINFKSASKEYSETLPIALNGGKDRGAGGNGKHRCIANIDMLIDNPHIRSSFESLVRVLPVTSWIYESCVVPIILQHTIPPPLAEVVAPDGPGGQAEREAMGKTPEAVMKSYVGGLWGSVFVSVCMCVYMYIYI